MYRVNYGNGQVSQTFKSLNAARQELARLSCGFAYVQRYVGDGEWARVR